MELLSKLIDEINKYDQTDEASNRLRDLICYISDKKKYQNDPFYRSLLFDAAQLMRTFGYNIQNKISIDEVCGCSGLNDIRQQAIHNYYFSKAYPNNLIDRRQKEIIDYFNSLDIKRMIVSAPTSFGKTFILREILYLNKERYNNILLIFPTVALLNENTIVINELNKNLNLKYTIINNVYSPADEHGRNIYILTPERTLKLLASNENINVDFFFFDEVYKIDEDLNRDEDTQIINIDTLNDYGSSNRAKAFRITLYLLSKKIKEYYIAGPYLNLHAMKPGFKNYINTNHISVKQIDFEPTLRIEVDAWTKTGKELDPFKGIIPIKFDYNGSPQNTKEKIRALISYIDQNNLGQAIIYCATPGYTMKYANNLVSALNRSSRVTEKHLPFIQHLRKRYGIKYHFNGQDIVSSDYWSLINILSAGYGVHHGKFPKYIQKEILNIFNAGDVDYLFCTSTIIEGVNTNAKNVIIVNNKLGSGVMTAFALKNIRGRAGRYYHHFIGRVFYANREQRDIESQDNMRLNFSIYDDIPISDIDYDNADLVDLPINRRETKQAREGSFDKDILPDEVFYKNRLFPRDVQEKYLNYLLDHLHVFEPLRRNPGNIPYFLNNNFMNTILSSLTHVNIIKENTARVYWAISDTYSKNHFQGLMRYQLDTHLENPLDDIDGAYLKVFTQIRNTIEFEIPRLLSLFESLFKQACILNDLDVLDFDMSSIIRYFELGVRTAFGIYLVEFGFPADAIRDIEDGLPALSSMNLQESTRHVTSNLRTITNRLDQYEKTLLDKAIVSAG